MTGRNQGTKHICHLMRCFFSLGRIFDQISNGLFFIQDNLQIAIYHQNLQVHFTMLVNLRIIYFTKKVGLNCIIIQFSKIDAPGGLEVQWKPKSTI